MTIFHDQNGAVGAPAMLSPETQQTLWFPGALIQIRAYADATGGRMHPRLRIADAGVLDLCEGTSE
jgi:hypothetical protein